MADNAAIAAGPQPLGRPLTVATNVTVNLIQPYTVFADSTPQHTTSGLRDFPYGGSRAQVASTSTT